MFSYKNKMNSNIIGTLNKLKSLIANGLIAKIKMECQLDICISEHRDSRFAVIRDFSRIKRHQSFINVKNG